jgi:hypothetical protein
MAIFIVCLGAGATLAARWLPPLAGPRGRWAWLVTCGLLGAAVTAAGLEIYLTARDLNQSRRLDIISQTNANVVASGLRGGVYVVGVLVGLAALIYLLAARSDTRAAQPSAQAPSSPAASTTSLKT